MTDDDTTPVDEETTPVDADATPVTDDTSDQDFLAEIVKQIVSKPEAVKIERKVDEMGVLLTLEVDKEDMGQIIGKSGQTAKALRVLLRVLGSKNNARVNLKIVEPDEA
ncbi:KH domain-containing protein [Candidatus Peregrinibacteria bacterium]|nr:KH domain-containing protein [Candidatus Peregrinibacteria bacterium]MBT4147854.1 KH domain-containing protein [Candidatus Peregrinibacteria bacterium]MBT4366195.1 KH domain-containing protein [Candidatus Peregrinibacteria bacterium]MBT4456318.1 KH domain-containing protein [Candidatus Peregrinibacteria bacterium]